MAATAVRMGAPSSLCGVLRYSCTRASTSAVPACGQYRWMPLTWPAVGEGAAEAQGGGGRRRRAHTQGDAHRVMRTG